MWVGEGRKQINFWVVVKNITISLILILAYFSLIVNCPSTNLYEANGSRNSTQLLFFTLLSRVVARRGLREDFSLLDLFWLEDREAEAETKESSMYLSLQKEKALGAERLRTVFLGFEQHSKRGFKVLPLFSNKLISTARSKVVSAWNNDHI